MSSKKRTIEEVKKDLEEARRRLRDVEERGNEALSDYDLSMGYDADFYLNKCPLLANHLCQVCGTITAVKTGDIGIGLFENGMLCGGEG